MKTPPQLKSDIQPGHVDFNLDVKYVEGRIYNPKTNRYDWVKLRSYVHKDKWHNYNEFVGPTIEVQPGKTVRVNLANKLPEKFDPQKCQDKQGKPEENELNCNNYNITNLHSHGLWISPAGNSDNVLSVVKPGVTFQYEYNIPSDHPAGTFWYHPHLHGSSALQVGSGMSGALIVRGDRVPSKGANGDIDTLLNEAGVGKQQEETLVVQQIQYACEEKKETREINGRKEIIITKSRWDCTPEETGEIEYYQGVFGGGVKDAWSNSGRYSSINGKVMPTFLAETGEIKRWRIIHAGVRNTINLEFRKAKDDAPPSFYELNAGEEYPDNTYRKRYCPNTNEKLPYHIIADDGLTRSAAYETKLTTLQPGYRKDALVVFPKPGLYCVVDAESKYGVSGSEPGQILGFVQVTGDDSNENIHQYLTDKLVAAANKFPDDIKDRIVNDLSNGLKLTAFTPHPDIQDSEVIGHNVRHLSFNIDTSAQHPIFQVSNDIGDTPRFQDYNHKRVDRVLTLGEAEEWRLQSNFVGHPFHIHVNPFQIVAIYDPNGKDVSGPNTTDNYNGTTDPDLEYRGLKGVWKDTIWVKPPSGNKRYTVVIRTRYDRYIGDFVLHCHILDHEDEGMMQNVSIVIPGTAPLGTDGNN